jgi:hypothetical protein
MAVALLPAPQQRVKGLTQGHTTALHPLWTAWGKAHLAANLSLALPAPRQVRGHTKKGKEFYRFNTNLTEPIRRLAVHDQDLWTAADYVHNHWREGASRGTYVAPDKIHDMEVGGGRGMGDMCHLCCLALHGRCTAGMRCQCSPQGNRCLCSTEGSAVACARYSVPTGRHRPAQDCI